MALTKISTAMISQSAAAVDLNVDAGTFYVDTTNNRVGVGGKTDPDTPLHVIGTATATLFAGSGASLTSIPNSALVNSSITINSTAVSLGGSLTLTTANIAENTNLYYTNARADARIAAADTDDLSEGSSNLYYTDARVDARVSGGSLGNITTTGYIRGPATFTIDPAAHGDNTGTVVIAGNLQVDGTQTVINSTTLTVDDKNITLASGSANAAAASGAGFTVDIGTGTNPAITYDGTNDEWDFNKKLNVTGSVTSTTGFTTSANTRVQASSGMLFLNGPSAVTFEVGAGSEKMRLTSTGLGIGTTSPTHKLHTSTSATGVYIQREISSNAANLSEFNSNRSLIIKNRTGGSFLMFGGNGSRTDIQATDGAGTPTAKNIALNPFGGNVGIGTTSPVSNLHIKTSVDNSVAQGLVIERSANTDRGYINYNGGGFQFRSTVGDPIIFGETDHEHMRIIPDGNVGIGTDTPDYTLELVGDSMIGDASAVTSPAFAAQQNIVKSFQYGTNGIGRAGNLYLLNTNTSRDSGFLTFGAYYNNTNNLYYQTGGIGGGKETAAGSGWGGYLSFWTTSDGTAGAASAQFEHMRITADGNVGIGTTSPAAKLEVAGGSTGLIISNLGDASAYDRVELQYSGYNSGTPVFKFRPTQTPGSGTVNSYFRFMNSNGTSTSANNYANVTIDGKVGIGATAPADKLHISGGNILLNNALEIRTKDTGGNLRTIMRANSSNELEYGWSANAPVKFMGGGSYTERMRIHTNGNIGIGTSSPTAPLSIRKVHATGYGSGIDMLDFKAYYPPNYDTETSKATIFVGTSDKHALNTHGGYLAFRVNQSGYAGTSGATNLAEAMRIEKDGNVGIGTSSPGKLLTLSRATEAQNEQLEFRNVGGISDGNFDGIRWSQGATGATTLAEQRINYKTTGVVDMSFNLRNEDSVLYLKAGGNVGVGTASPAQKLEIEGDVRIKDSRSLFFKRHGDNYAWRIRNESSADATTHGFDGSNDLVFEVVSSSQSVATPAAASHSIYPSSANTLVLKETGRVGIGTDSPAHPFHITRELAGYQAYFNNDNGSAQGIKVRIKSNDSGNFNMLELVSASTGSDVTAMVVRDDGNVGIGTTSPTLPLDVSREIASSIGQTSTYNYANNRNWAMRTNNYGSSNWGGWSLEQSTSHGGTPSVARIGVHLNGNVGINMGGDASTSLTNKNPATALHVGGDITVGSADSVGTSGTASIRFQNDNERSRITSNYASGGGGQMGFWTDTTGGSLLQRMTITNDGNVGIGNTGPASRLTVNGTIALYDANADPDLTVTESGNVGKMASGEINIVQGWSGTLTAGDTLIFTYNKVSWAAYGFEIEGTNAGHWGKIEGGGYSNGGPGLQSHTNVGTLFSSFAITSTPGNNQGLVMTMTLSGGVHTVFRIRYFQGGGDSVPVASRATLDLNS